MYADFDVPQNLQFKTTDIVRMGRLQCSAALPAALFKGVLQAPNQITKAHISLSFSVANHDVLVQGSIDGERQVQCARCLAEVKQPFCETFSETYSTKCEIIDIMLVVRQTLALTEDIRFLCKPDCKGLCAQCGTNLNEKACSCQPENLSPFAMLKGKFK